MSMTRDSRSWFTGLAVLSTVITVPGNYITRNGEQVTITEATSRHEFQCHGFYPNGVAERWHKSGRLLFGQEQQNDIVRSV